MPCSDRLRIGNDVSYVRRIKQSSHFAWQAQHLARFKRHFVAGAVFGEVQASLQQYFVVVLG